MCMYNILIYAIINNSGTVIEREFHSICKKQIPSFSEFVALTKSIILHDTIELHWL